MSFISQPFVVVITICVAFICSSFFSDVTCQFMILACYYMRLYRHRRRLPCQEWIKGFLPLLGELLIRLWLIISSICSVATFISNTNPSLSYVGPELQSTFSFKPITSSYMYQPPSVKTITGFNSTLIL